MAAGLLLLAGLLTGLVAMHALGHSARHEMVAMRGAVSATMAHPMGIQPRAAMPRLAADPAWPGDGDDPVTALCLAVLVTGLVIGMSRLSAHRDAWWSPRRLMVSVTTAARSPPVGAESLNLLTRLRI